MLTGIAAKHRLFVVVGGGGGARDYIEVARSLNIDEGTADEIGILVTRPNATLLISALGESAYPKVAESHSEAKKFAESKKIVVMGGITLGQTTDAVAAVLAERVHADVFVNVTSVNGIYDKDPKKFTGAKYFKTLTPSQLIGIVGKGGLGAGCTMSSTSSLPGWWSAAISRSWCLTARRQRTFPMPFSPGNANARS